MKNVSSHFGPLEHPTTKLKICRRKETVCLFYQTTGQTGSNAGKTNKKGCTEVAHFSDPAAKVWDFDKKTKHFVRSEVRAVLADDRPPCWTHKCVFVWEPMGSGSAPAPG